MLAGIAEVRFFPKKEIKLENIEKLLSSSAPTPRLPVTEKQPIRISAHKALTKHTEHDILDKIATLALLGALITGIWLNVQES